MFVRLPRRFSFAASLLAGRKVATWSQILGPIAAVYTTLGLTEAQIGELYEGQGTGRDYRVSAAMGGDGEARRQAQLAGVGWYHPVSA